MTIYTGATLPGKVEPARAIAIALTLLSDNDQIFAQDGDEVRLVLLAIKQAGWKIVACKSARLELSEINDVANVYRHELAIFDELIRQSAKRRVSKETVLQP